MLLNLGMFQSTVANLASYFSIPTIGALYSVPDETNNVIEFFQKLTDFFKIGIPVYPDKYEEKGENQIGEQVLVSGLGTDKPEGADSGANVTGALVKVADNIVVTPRSWTIHGYIGFKMDGMVGGMVGSMLSAIPVPALSSFLQTFGRDTLNDLMKRCLRYISEARRPFKFYTTDGETVPSLIKSYNLKQVAENQNWVEVDLEIQEFRCIALTKDGQESVGGVKGLYSSASGFAAQMGRSALKVLAL